MKKLAAALGIIVVFSLSYVFWGFVLEKFQGADGALNLETLSTEPAATEVPQSTETPAPAESGDLLGADQGILITLYDAPYINQRVWPMEAVYADYETQDATRQALMEENGNLRYQRLWLDDISLLEVYREDIPQRQLLLFLHGLGGEKEDLLSMAISYAQAGYHVVAMDAFNQGERSITASYCDFYAAILITVSDMDHVIAYYDSVPAVDNDNFILGGFSMGAVESWCYGMIGQREPGALLALCGVSEYGVWQSWVAELLPYMWLKAWNGLVWSFPELQADDYTAYKWSVLEAMNISEHAQDFADIPIFCGVGTEDNYFSAAQAEQTMASLRAAGNDALLFKSYERLGHEIDSAMFYDSLLFLQDLREQTAEKGGEAQ